MDEGAAEPIRSELLKMFTPGYKFPLQDTDDNLKVEIKDWASFGSLWEASATYDHHESPTNDEPIFTHRKFCPGKYKVTVIRPYKPGQFSDDPGMPLVVFHHENVDPNLVMLQVIRFGEDYEASLGDSHNCINRYDWLSGCCGDDCEKDRESDIEQAEEKVVDLLENDLKQDVRVTLPQPYRRGSYSAVIFFANAQKSSKMEKLIMKKQIRQSANIQYLCSVEDDNGETVSIAVNFTPYTHGDYTYGKLFVDSDTDACFALVVNATGHWQGPWEDILTSEELKDLGFADIGVTGLKFPMDDFMIKND